LGKRGLSDPADQSIHKANGYEVIFIWENDFKGIGRKLAFSDSGVRDPWVYAKA
jgi:hypothetical protein